jgi:hypothetical protein
MRRNAPSKQLSDVHGEPNPSKTDDWFCFLAVYGLQLLPSILVVGLRDWRGEYGSRAAAT